MDMSEHKVPDSGRTQRSYGAWSLLREALTGHRGWAPAWRDARPGPAYDVVIVGGGGHGLACAYYLARRHGLKRIAVLERNWIGGGNTARNTTVIRSNYFYPQSVALYGLAHRMYGELSRELGFNIMFSRRGNLTVCHSDHDLEIGARTVNAMQLNGADAALLDATAARRLLPLYNRSPHARYPLLGGIWQPSGGTARHDAVAWGYARAASALGVDIVQNCEVLDFLIEGGECRGVVTTEGTIRAGRTALAVAGHSSLLAARAGFHLPLTSFTLQAMVSQPIAPALDTVLVSPATGTYVNQSDKGEIVIGGALDRLPSYAQRGGLPVTEQVLAGLLEMFPAFATLRLMRQWGGTVDVTPDSSPLLGPSPVPGLFLNCGWGTGGFKAIPAGGLLLAHLLATGDHHPISRPFDIARFSTGALIDEAASAAIAH
jgi:sarcosine oxidase, subunit beta